MRWISSMNRISPGTSDESSAARSPACWMAGPLDIRSGRPLSCATIIASVVLPSPGGPASRMWSGVRCWIAAACSSSCSCPRTFDWPTNSASDSRTQGALERELGFRLGCRRMTIDLVVGDLAGIRSVRRSCAQLPGPSCARARRSRRGTAVASSSVALADGILDGLRRDALVPAESDEGHRDVVGTLERREPRRGDAVVADRTSLPASDTTMSFAVFGPMPDTLRNAASSSSATACAISLGAHRGQHAHGALRPDARDAAQQVEHLQLVSLGEPVERQVVLAHDERGVQPSPQSRPAA